MINELIQILIQIQIKYINTIKSIINVGCA